MSFLRPNPDHVWHPDLGWLEPEDAARFDVGERLGRGGRHGHTCKCPTPCPPHSNHPERDHPHYVEIDVSTGMVGYTRLTEAEIEHRRRGQEPSA